jgi:hypothetical protein
VTQSVLLPLNATLAQIRLAVLELVSPTCTCSMSFEKVSYKMLTLCTVMRLSKSTRHHVLDAYAVIEKVGLRLSFAKLAWLIKSSTPTATCALNVLDCVAAHALLRPSPHDLAKFSCEIVSSYVGPLYPALHVQFQMDTEPTGEALVGTHEVQTVMPCRSAYVLAGHSVHADEFDPDLYFPMAQPTQNGP